MRMPLVQRRLLRGSSDQPGRSRLGWLGGSRTGGFGVAGVGVGGGGAG